MSKRRKSRIKPKNNNWPMLVIGLLFGGGLIAFSVLTALSQATQDSAPLGDVVLGAPLQVAAPTRMLGDVSILPSGQVTHVDMVYFHRTQRCPACMNAGRYARETVETYFIEFRISNATLLLPGQV